MHALMCELGYTTMAINNFFVIVVDSGEKAKWDEEDWSAPQSSTIRQRPVRAALCSLPSLFPLTAPLGRNRQQECEAALCSSLLVCRGVSAWSWAGAATGAAGRSAQARMGWTAAQQCYVLADCCFYSTGREEEPLPWRPSKAWPPPSCVRR